MTIEKGSPWGEPAVAPVDTPSFAGCAALGAYLAGARAAAGPFACRLRADSFARLLGRSTPSDRGGLRIPVDVLEVYAVVDGREYHGVCVDSLVLGDHLLWGALVIVTNTGFWRGRRLAPRAHPNDGRADVVTVDTRMTPRQRLSAWHRMRWGTHLPHPHASVEQHRAIELDGPPRKLTIDGVRVGVATAVRIRVQPDALMLYV